MLEIERGPKASLSVGPLRSIKLGPRENLLYKRVDTLEANTDNTPLVSAEGYPSGQRGQTVNLLAMPS